MLDGALCLRIASLTSGQISLQWRSPMHCFVTMIFMIPLLVLEVCFKIKKNTQMRLSLQKKTSVSYSEGINYLLFQSSFL